MIPALQGKLQAPKAVRAGAMFTVQVLLRHDMDSGFITDANGARIPQNLLKHIEMYLDEVLLLRLTPSSGVAANPYFEFPLAINKAGQLICRFEDERGAKGELTSPISLL